MGTSKGVLILAGVLVVIMVPYAAGSEPRFQEEPQAVTTVKDVVSQGGEAGEEAADDAQGQAKELQESASETKHGLADDVREGAGSAASLAAVLLAEFQSVAAEAMEKLNEVVNGVFTYGTPPSSGYSHGQMRIRANEAAVAGSGPATGVAMVLAAGALGGALLWWVVLKRAVMFGAVPMLSRIAHSEIYANDARRLISELAVQNPGLCLNEIVSKTGYSRNAVSYHLFVLEKEEEIVSIKDGKYRRYFPRGGKYVNGAKNVVSALRNPVSLSMAQHIVQHPGTIQRELCKALGTTASAACWHAKRLETLGVIQKERVANTVQYYPGEALHKYDLAEFGLRTLDAAPAPAPVPAPAAVLPA